MKAAPDILKSPVVMGIGALLVLLASGLGGGVIAGFRVEPQECAEARVKLAELTARLELGAEAMAEVRAAVGALTADRDRIRTERDDLRRSLDTCMQEPR